MQRKPIFDAVRQMLGRGFKHSEVIAIDRAIEASLAAADGAEFALVEPVTDASPESVALIKKFEGCAKRRADGQLQAYPDPGTGDKPWTIGWGATGLDGRQVCRDDVISQDRADALLHEEIERHAAEVAEVLAGAPTSQLQFDAMVSFHYNTGAIGRSTLARLHRAGDYEGAADELLRWNRAGGRVLKGLVRRREAEAALYRKGC